MGDEGSEADQTANLVDDAPTERISIDAVQHTNPTHAGVLSSDLAASIRADFAATVADEDTTTFVGIVEADGRILVAEHIRKAGVFSPGEKVLIQATKIT